MRPLALTLVVICSLAAGCFTPDVPDGELACSGDAFGVPAGTVGAKGAGLFLLHVPVAAAFQQPAAGDTFANCPPTSTMLATATAIPTSYVDIAYYGVSMNPVSASGCTPTPP